MTELSNFSTEELEGELRRRERGPVEHYAQRIGFSERMLRMLRQDEVWIGGDGSQLSIEDMEQRHVDNLLAWLWRNRVRLRAMEEFEFVVFDAPDEVQDEYYATTGAMEDREWFEDLPLVQKLRELRGEQLRGRLDRPVG